MTCFLPRTLRARLTVLIVLSTSLVLASTGVLVYETLKGRLEATSSAEMMARCRKCARISPRPFRTAYPKPVSRP